MVDPANYVENGKLIRAPYAVKALGEDLFGDKLNLYRGTLQFEQTDVSLPGSSRLPVAVTRTLNAGVTSNRGQGLFREWELEVPHMQGTFLDGAGWVGRLPDNSGTQLRCTNFGAPPKIPGTPYTPGYQAGEFWRGNFMHVPGYGSQEVLKRDPNNANVPADGQATPLVTKGLWAIRCLNSMSRGAGEGFLAIAPDGTQYKFDWLVERDTDGLSKPLSSGGHYSISRKEVWLMATKVTDRFGNTVEYKYDYGDPWRLNEIVASDGRHLTFTYEPGTHRINSVTDGTRTWSYVYVAEPVSSYVYLAGVVLPDNSRWDFSGMVAIQGIQAQNIGLIHSDFYYTDPTPENPITECDTGLSVSGTADLMTTVTGTMKHPSGATGTFVMQPMEHGRNGVPRYGCYYDGAPNSVGKAIVSRYSANYSLITKTLSGPGMPNQTWQMAYDTWYPGWDDCQACTGQTAKVTVTEPGGVRAVHTFGNTFGVNEGLPLITEILEQGSSLQRSVLSYSNQFPTPVGTSEQWGSDGGVTNRHVPVQHKVITRGGIDFSWQADSFDTKARPTSVTRSSPAASRSETTQYHDELSLWVLSQVEVLASEGKEVVRNTFDSRGQIDSVSRFGVLQHRYGYNNAGNTASIEDGAGNKTFFDDYKLGIPQAVRYPTGATAGSVVDSLGQITQATDAAGFTTAYGYDAGGRVSLITPPGGFAPISIEFVPVTGAEYGLDAGHWRQTVSKGRARTVTYYDARWRALMTRTFDADNEANTRKVVVRAFDHKNRTVYESYPQRDAASVGSAPWGTYTKYDGLGRVSRVEADSELAQGRLITTSSYSTGLHIDAVNPRGIASSQSLWALDNPDQTQLSVASLPLGVSVTIVRDNFGKPSSIARGDGAKSVTRSYVYDAGQRLCKTVEPEIGATIQAYDAAGNIRWRAPGQKSLTGLGGCDDLAVSDSGKITYGYDELNRLKTTVYGDNSPAVSRTYKPDGLPDAVISNGSTWTHEYNAIRQLTAETFNYAGNNYAFNRDYNLNGDLRTLTYPDVNGNRLSVDYNPNALGETTSVGGYASGIAYHPNGLISGYSLGNGVGHSLSLNARGLPLVNADAGVMSDLYSYDANGNISGIVDQQEGITTRSMSYDSLDRLKTANAPGVWGNATYDYDAVDNLVAANIGARSTALHFDAGTNQLDKITINGSDSSVLYDDRGNVKNKGAQGYFFDLGNRMVSSTLGGTYAYDGDGRRFKSVSVDVATTRVAIYSQGGQLLWSESASNTGSTPASVSYNCASGSLVNNQCVTTNTYGATPGYSCNAGDTLSGSTCTYTTSSTYTASQSPYTCNAGDSLSGSTCTHTTTSSNTYVASVNGYSCNAGDSLSGGTCTHTTFTAATANYSCPGGYTLSGTTCSTTTSTAASAGYGCGNLGVDPEPYSASPNGYGCTAELEGYQAGAAATTACRNMGTANGMAFIGLEFNKWETSYCHLAARVVYFCPSGGTVSGNQCVNSSSQAATVGYSCSSGTLSGSQCVSTSSYTGSVTGYSCNAGDSLSGSTCTHTTSSSNTYAASGGVYSCPSGGSLSGSTCTQTGSGTYGANIASYSCNNGDSRSGGTCTHQSYATPNASYSCNSGTLSGQNCVGISTTSRTAYVHLGAKQIAEIKDGVTQYVHTDVLGSPVAHTAGTGGTVLNRTRFEPYGFVAAGTKPGGGTAGQVTTGSAIGFTGHVQDPDTDLVYMQQRYYDPIAGRFLSVDPVVTDANTGGEFGRYTYVENNPYSKIDPNGELSEIQWNSPTHVTVTIPYRITEYGGAKLGFTKAAFEKQVAKDFSGVVKIGDRTIQMDVRAEERATGKVNEVQVVNSLAGITSTGREETRGGTSGNPVNYMVISSSTSVDTASHEMGHGGGAGDQYKTGIGADGKKLKADIPGPNNRMRDNGPAGANQKTRNEIGGRFISKDYD